MPICNKGYSNNIDEELKNPFKNTFKFSNDGINRFILLLRKDIYLYEYMDKWEKFDEASLPKKEIFIATKTWKILLMKIISTQKFKRFETKNLDEYHDLYFASLLANVFENLRKMCLEIYQLDHAQVLTVPGLAWQAALKRAK